MSHAQRDRPQRRFADRVRLLYKHRMNWKRVCTGAGLAATFIVIAELALLKAVFVAWPAVIGAAVPLLLAAPVMGLFLSGGYAFARPRLGPGPKTALLTGSCIGATWTLALYPVFFIALRASMGLTVAYLASRFLSCLMGSYVAGWQYIEKAPA